jgi:putative FmdB family regulatory protein
VGRVPIYEYRCRACGNHFELLQETSSRIPKACPVCGGKLIKAVTHPGRIIFKDLGLYATDCAEKLVGE